MTTIIVPKRILRLAGVVITLVCLVGIQLAFDPIGKHQAFIAKRAEIIRQRQAETAKQAEKPGVENKAEEKGDEQAEQPKEDAAPKQKSETDNLKEEKNLEEEKGNEKKDLLSLVEERGAQVVANAKNLKPGFFTEFRLERDRVRDQQLELLKEIIANGKTEEKTRHSAQEKMLEITENLGKELEVENLIKAKKYDDAIVFLQEDSAVVVIKAKKLTSTDAQRISDLVKRSTNLTDENIVVIPRE